MIHELLNTLYVQTQGVYVHLDHDTLEVAADGVVRLQVPLHHLSGLVVFGNVLVSPFVIHRFSAEGRSLVWFNQHGQFQARLSGPVSGNVLLRCAQHETQKEPAKVLHLARRFVAGKIRNARAVLLRGRRDATQPAPSLAKGARDLEQALSEVERAGDLDHVRGIEGRAALTYFAAFGELIGQKSLAQGFTGRSRRPPRDPVNALLSFAYALLAQDCLAACEGVGLDPQVGYLHALRPGRPALALDLMEEFRAIWADRLVLTLLNRRQITGADFVERPGGAIHLSDHGRRVFLEAYQRRKQEEIMHPVVKTRTPIGLLPHVQARLLARYLRGDVGEYPPFVVR